MWDGFVDRGWLIPTCATSHHKIITRDIKLPGTIGASVVSVDVEAVSNPRDIHSLELFFCRSRAVNVALTARCSLFSQA